MTNDVGVSVEIAASPSEVFAFFIESQLMVEWMGDVANLDPRPGGDFRLEVEGTKVVGRFLEVDPPHRVVFSWGFDGSDALPPGTSQVEVALSPTLKGTLVELRHRGLRNEATAHSRGWIHFLGLLRTTVEARH